MRTLCMTIVLTLWLASEVFAGGGVQFFVAPQHVFVPQAVVIQHQLHHPQPFVQPFVQRQVVQRQFVVQQPAQVNVQVRRGFFPRVFGPRVNVQVNR